MSSSTRRTQVLELIQGAWSYLAEVQLSLTECTVTVGTGQCMTKNRVDDLEMSKKRHRFEDADTAALFFRYELSRLSCLNYRLLRGDAVALDASEDFKKVKHKSSNYLYFENAATNMFWDIDRDYADIHIWEGEVGTRGEELLVGCEWDGEARERFAGLVAGKRAMGFVPAGEQVAHAFLHNSEGELAASLRAFYEEGRHTSFQHHSLRDLEYMSGRLYVDFDVIDGLENPDFTEEMIGEGYVEFANLIADLESDPEGYECYAHLAIHTETTRVYLLEPSGDPELVANTLEEFLTRLHAED